MAGIDPAARARSESLNGDGSVFKAVVDRAPFGAHVFELDGHDRLILVDYNATAVQMLGIDHAPLVGLPIEDAFPGAAQTGAVDACYRVARSGGTWDAEQLVYVDESVRSVHEVHVHAFGECGAAVFFRDITHERERARLDEERRRESDLNLNKAQHYARLGSWVWDIQSNELEWSDEMYVLFGIDKERFTGYLPDVIASAIHPDDRAILEAANRSVIEDLRPEPAEYRIVWPDGSVHTVWAEAGEMVLAADGAPLKLMGTVQDVTSQRRRSVLASLDREVLEILNRDEELRSSVAEIVSVIKRKLDSDAVGIRLQDGEDFPYFAQSGFSDEHINSENSLLVRDSNGAPCRDDHGDAVLECSCGQVLTGRDHPGCSPGGSLWSADAQADLAATNPAVDTRVNPRNLCVTEGYASIAIVPIKNRDHTVGVLHIADRHAGTLDIDVIEMLEATAAHIGQALTRKYAESALRASNVRLEGVLRSIITTLGKVVETRDPYTQGHEQGVATIGRLIAEEVGVSAQMAEEVEVAALVHDVGKLAVPVEILTKPGRLADLEYEMIQMHVLAGYELLKGVDFGWDIAEIVLQHHERMDGSGYPHGLSGDQISQQARILMVADVIEAMASHRPYRPALGLDVAMAEITEHPQKFDEQVVAACVRLHAAGRLAAAVPHP